MFPAAGVLVVGVWILTANIAHIAAKTVRDTDRRLELLEYSQRHNTLALIGLAALVALQIAQIALYYLRGATP